MTYRMTREFFIPKNSTKISAKDSSAVAYLYADKKDRPCARVFSGKRAKPDSKFYYRTDAERAKFVAVEFDSIRDRETAKKERQESRKAEGRGLAVGDIVDSSWGYDQTNVEFYEVTALVGKTMVELRELAQTREDTHWAQWRALPVLGSYVGSSFRRVAKSGYVSITSFYGASLWNGQPRSASNYA